MSAPEPKRGDSAAAMSDDGRKFLLRQAPYLVALLLALGGVAYSNIARQPLTGYWELLALAMAVMCVVTQWDSASDRSARFRLIGTQTLHWAAVLVAMNIMMLNRVQSMLPAPALSLVLLTLLALGTFLAGVNFLSVQICFLGLAMALAVPAIAWLTQSFLFLVLALLLVAGIGVAVWPSVASRRFSSHAKLDGQA
ncbi:MAG TPA: hypothetical protein VJY34_25745 [Roseiarcus sp.]|nr:hypothetical protein [Roseiarcus sp.]